MRWVGGGGGRSCREETGGKRLTDIFRDMGMKSEQRDSRAETILFRSQFRKAKWMVENRRLGAACAWNRGRSMKKKRVQSGDSSSF